MSGGSAAVHFRPIFKAFEDKFGIEVRSSGGNARLMVDRVLAERSLGKYTLDVFWGGAGNYQTRLIPNNALGSMLDAWILPEVKDPSNWYQGKHWWMDVERPGEYAFAFSASAPVSGPTHSAWVNTDLVSSEEIAAMRSIWDLVGPQFEGRVVARVLDEDSRSSLLNLYATEGVGPDWLRRLLSPELGVLFTQDYPQNAAQLARGAYALCFCSGASEELRELQGLGAPVFEISEHARTVDWKEGGTMSPGGSRGLSTWMANPVHPNAVKVWVNWFLSKEGQTAYHTLPQNFNPSPTLRTDVTELGNTDPATCRLPGVQYNMISMSDDAAESAEKASALMKELLDARGR